MGTHRHLILVLLGAFVLTGCASTSPQRKQDLATVSADGVPSHIQAKMENNVALDLSDIETLSRKKVDDGVTLRYLRSSRVIYNLDNKSVAELRTAKVSERVINYLLSTPTLYNTHNQLWPIDPAKTPTRDPLLNGQAVPRTGY